VYKTIQIVIQEYGYMAKEISEEEIYEEAKKRVKAKRGFYRQGIP
jgi:hypothetical protein